MSPEDVTFVTKVLVSLQKSNSECLSVSTTLILAKNSRSANVIKAGVTVIRFQDKGKQWRFAHETTISKYFLGDHQMCEY